MGQLTWYHVPMIAGSAERTLEELAAVIVDSDDPALCERACRALDALLASAGDAGDRWL